MKKFVFILMVVLMATTVMAAVQRQIQFVDEYGYPIDVSYVYITDAADDTASTIYKGRALSNAITNPMDATSTNTGIIGKGLVQWFSRSANKYDLVANAGGTQVRVVNLTDAINQITVIGTDAVGGKTSAKGCFDNFYHHPICAGMAGATAGPSGTAGVTNIMYTGDNMFEYAALGTQTILGPDRIATGLDMGSGDQTADDGWEVNGGSAFDIGDQSFTVGQDGAFSFSLEVMITDVSGTDDFAIGFRKREANQADVSDYDEMAAFNIKSAVIYLETILNDGETNTDTTLTDWADLGTHTLKISVSATGVTTFLYDGVEPTVTVAHTFDDGEVLIPFVYLRHDTDLADDTGITHWNCRLD
jgi:hypothetical protein